MTSTWKVARVGTPPTIDFLRIARDPAREPGPGEILVKVQASSLNFHDFVVVTGIRNEVPGVIPMSDGAGVIEAVGAGVKGLSVGDQVVSLFFPLWKTGDINLPKVVQIPGDTLDGFAAEYVVKPADYFTRAPAGYSAEESATLPCAALTAWRALIVEAKTKPGDTVLVQGSGGVSIFALQFAKALGAQVIATSSSPAKMERLKALGADHVINYRETPDWGAEVQKLTGGGADLVVEVAGGSAMNQSIAATRIGGHISLIGVLAGFQGEVATAALMARNICLKGITVGSREHQLDMIKAIEVSGIRPVIGERFALDDIAEAFRTMQAQTHFGKIVLNIG
jgi:NADPH:quinone reductase-like Zn-dependent oxidoreductase